MSDSAISPRTAGHRKKRRWAFRLAALILSVVLLEGLSAVVLRTDLPGIPQNIGMQRLAIMQSASPSIHPTEAIHPYLGWVLNPDLHPSQAAGDRLFPVNALGFVDDGETLYKRSPDRIIVGIVGGSVAQHVSLVSDEVLRKRLESAPSNGGRRTVQFVRLALSGHKQPQQLMSVAYLLSRGGELDVLINIDGYNETVLALTENALSGIALSYPRQWHYRLQDVVDPRIDSDSYELLRLRVYRRRAARFFDLPVLRQSPTCNLAWLAYDRWVERCLTDLGENVRVHRQELGHGFAKDGPKDHFSSEEELANGASEIWTEASRQLHRLCAANGIRYLHVLQPNQYLEGSKPLSPLEREKCYAPEERHAAVVRTMYPLLRKAGATLATEGVDFHDATQLFSEVEETLYSDYFCHFNQKGNDLLAEAVAGWLVENADASRETRR